MDIEVIEDLENKYIDRRELRIRIMHSGSPTPRREEVFKEVIGRLDLEADKTILLSMKTHRGMNVSEALIYYYPNGIDWSTIEPVKRGKVIKLGEEESKEEG